MSEIKKHMREYLYAKEKINHAIYILATGEEEIRTRLLHATKRLHVLNRADSLPQHLQERWNKIWHQLTRFGISHALSGKENMGPIEHTMKRIKKKTARGIAEELYDLSTELKNY